MTEMDAGGSIQSLLDRMPCTEVPHAESPGWGEDGRSWFSIAEAAALAAALSRYGSALE